MTLICEDCLESFGFSVDDVLDGPGGEFVAECPFCGLFNVLDPDELEDQLGHNGLKRLQYKFEKDPFDALSETEG